MPQVSSAAAEDRGFTFTNSRKYCLAPRDVKELAIPEGGAGFNPPQDPPQEIPRNRLRGEAALRVEG